MKRLGTLVCACLVAVMVAAPGAVRAQDEISQSHLDAAWAAVRALQVNTAFSGILPDAAESVENYLIQLRPDLFAVIPEVVQEIALQLVPRRLDLNEEIKRFWAVKFTEEELLAIAEFYSSAAGQKLAAELADLQRDTNGIASDWGTRVANEMRERALLEFEQRGIDF